MDRPLAPPVADSRLSRALSASACGTLLLVVPVRLDEMAALLGAALRETVLQAAARQLETALHTLQQPATGAEALHRRGDGFLVVLGDASPEHVDTAARLLLDALEQPMEVAGQRFCLGGCAGRAGRSWWRAKFSTLSSWPSQNTSASSTRWRTTSLTKRVPFTTCETVVIDTPERAATSFMLAMVQRTIPPVSPAQLAAFLHRPPNVRQALY